MVVGGGLTGLWAALQAPRRTTRRASCCSRASGSRSARRAATAGSAGASLTHGIGNGVARWPEEMDALERLGRENLAASRRRSRATASTAAARSAASIAVATAAAPGRRGSPRRPSCYARFGQDADAARPRRRCAREVDSPTYLGGVWVQREARARRPGARCAGGWPTRPRRPGVRSDERTPVTRARPRRRRRRARTPRGRCGRAARCSHQRVPAAGARDPALRRAGLRLRAGDGAADARRSARRSAGRGARACPTSRTSSTTTG